MPSQKVGDFVYGLNQAFLFFGKLPKVILSDNLKSYVTKADRYDPEFNELAEQQHRAHKRMKMFLRLSKLRYQATIQDIDCSEARNLSKGKLMTLADCSYLQRGENVLITGATGCGKSYLTCALGHNACVHGYRTLYFNMNRLTEQIALAKTDGTLIKWLNRIKKAKLIIFDDFGLQPITHAVKLILLQILEDRYENAATIICSQLPVGQWHQYFDEPTIADAILDRIIPKAHRIELKFRQIINLHSLVSYLRY